MSVQARTRVEMVNCVKSLPAVKIDGEILDTSTSLVLKFQQTGKLILVGLVTS